MFAGFQNSFTHSLLSNYSAIVKIPLLVFTRVPLHISVFIPFLLSVSVNCFFFWGGGDQSRSDANMNYRICWFTSVDYPVYVRRDFCFTLPPYKMTG